MGPDRFYSIFWLLILLDWLVLMSCEVVENTNYDTAYELGMEAYKKEKWALCSSHFKAAIDDYHAYENSCIDCRLKCKTENRDIEAISSTEIHNTMFHDLLVESNCLRGCYMKTLGSRSDVEISTVLKRKFEERTPYNYMQFCYFKEGKFKQAASAAYTYYIIHRDDERILEALQYYRTLYDVTDEDFTDLERKPFQTNYVAGVDAYSAEEWEEACTSLEKCLTDYYLQEERCRAGCQNSYTHAAFPHFVNAIADHYVNVLVCQQACLRKLSNFGIDDVDDFVQEIYNYLQFAYYQSNNLQKAFESIANYLLFNPTDERMVKNKQYYINTLKHKTADFVPTKEVEEYVRHWRQRDESLDYIRETYTAPGATVHKDTEPQFIGGSMSEKPNDNIEHFERLGLKLVADGKTLQGDDRFMAENFVREDQCEALADMARSTEADVDGIKHMSLSEAADLVLDDETYEISMRLLLRGADIMQAYVKAYFSITQLHVQDIQLICRTASTKSDSKISDDCLLQENGRCFDSDALVADYMIVAYLTDVDDGTGHLYFRDEGVDNQAKIVPACGRVVGFSKKSQHSVNLSWKKERCAAVFTYTSRQSAVSAEVEEARQVLTMLQEQTQAEYAHIDNSALLHEFFQQGVKITTKGKELYGADRFVADGLATQDECQQLLQLAQLGTVEGDGYRDNEEDNPVATKFVSPFSKHENFEGLNLTRALELTERNLVPHKLLSLFLDISEHARLLVEKYLNLTQPLYFDFTHLVCRTAIPIKGDDADTDLQDSHPVHADNCMIQPDGSCLQDALAYIQRHYSAIVYLNDDFEGGNFFFAHNNQSEQVSVKPACGRLVAFNAGDYHGVKAVTKGQRCAIAMWYTHDPEFIEVARLHAARRLQKLDSENSKAKHTTTDNTAASTDISNEKSHEEL